MKRKEAAERKELLEGMPYTEEKIKGMKIAELKILASALGIETWQKTKAQTIRGIIREQHHLDLLDERVENFCEMCGNYVANRQKAHIAAEGDNSRSNILLLCPNCHLMFDKWLKPRLSKGLLKAGAK